MRLKFKTQTSYNQQHTEKTLYSKKNDDGDMNL